MEHKIYCGDSLKILPRMPLAKCIFIDPPDNLNLGYDTYQDNLDEYAYKQLLLRWRQLCLEQSQIMWYSFYHNYLGTMLSDIKFSSPEWKLVIWYYTFGQHNKNDFGTSFRPILRHIKGNAITYPQNVMEESERQKLGDKRANPDGRVPSDVWSFSRVCGNFTERRAWHPTQHPEALLERIIKYSTKEGDLVIDPCLGTGTTLRVCMRLNRRCIGIEQSPNYCEKIAQETGVKIQ